MIDVDKFRRHINKPFTFKIGEDDFQIKPLTVDSLPDLLVAYSIFDNLEKPEDLYTLDKYLSPEILLAMREIVVTSIRDSYPDLEEETLQAFAMKNFWDVLGAVFECNQFNQDKEKIDKIQKKLEQLREMQKDEKLHTKTQGTQKKVN